MRTSLFALCEGHQYNTSIMDATPAKARAATPASEDPRRLAYHDRFALQQADQAIRRDAVRALVELITNANDSYHRLEDRGGHTAGIIILEINRKRQDSVLRVRDFAEGMTGATMNQQVGTYGAPTSGFQEGQSVRGLWGRGLKDAFYGLGQGTVTSIVDGRLYQSQLYIHKGAPMYEPAGEGRPVELEDREQYQIPRGNGTVIEIIISRPEVPVPLYDTLRFKLQQHFELRNIMNNPGRRIFLRELGARDKIKREVRLSYRHPTGIRIYNEAFYVPGTPAMAHLEVFRSDEPLTTVSEAGDFADGGLLVVSKRVVLELTLLKFKHNEYATRIYGTLTCDSLHDLLGKEETEPILTATRDGLNWDHPFMQQLRAEIEARLEPLVQAERRLAQEAATGVADQSLRKRFNTALRRLNSIAKDILVGTAQQKTPSRPQVPFRGFGFTHGSKSIRSGRPAGVTLRAQLGNGVQAGQPVRVSSENPEVEVLTPEVELKARKDFPDIGEARVQIQGRQVGAEATIRAQANGYRAEARVKVTSKQPVEAPRRTSFITEIEFSASADPQQRVVFDREASKIVIATQAPSVKPYLGEGGAGADTAQGQVLLAELVTEAMTRAIARVGVQSGKLPALHDTLEASIRAHETRLQHEIGHEIHEYFVDRRFRKKQAGE